MSERVLNRRRMEGLVRRWRSSGAPLAAFARAQGVTRGKLEYWRQRTEALSEEARPARRDRVSFAPVHVVPGSLSRRALEVVLPDGVRVAVEENAAPELALAILEALRRAC